MTDADAGTLVRLRPRSETVYISHNRTVLATGRDGFILDSQEHGLFIHDTRMLSRWQWRIEDRSLAPAALSTITAHSWLGYYIAPPEAGGRTGSLGQGAPEATQHTIELRLSRYVGDGFHEDVDVTNYTRRHVSFTLVLECDADFADQDKPNSSEPQQRTINRQWRHTEDQVWQLAWSYEAQHTYDHQGEHGTARLQRGASLCVEHAGSSPDFEEETSRLRFRVELAPQASWHTCMTLTPRLDGSERTPVDGCYSLGDADNERVRRREAFLREATRFDGPGQTGLTPVVLGALEQARQDLIALRIYDYDHGDRAWLMAAGLPIYVALFGRDTLTAAWQAALAGPEMMRGTVQELAHWQGRERNDWRDEQPGRHLHEAYDRPLSALNFDPLARYYGSITTSAFYPVVVSELWHWTGDKELVGRMVESALKGLNWLDVYADIDDDGFYEYKTASAQGVKHQAWKDSDDAIVDEDGAEVQPPIATCEEQGFVYAAKLQLAEVLWWLDRKDEARPLYDQAKELKRRFNEAFWMEDEGFYAMGLDSHKRKIRSIGSNPGHCIATGIADTERVRRTADRLFDEDLYSGWGIRTLSSRNPAYNPYSYHRGTVWPVEQATFVLGFYRYGLPEHAQRLARAQFEAAALFDYYRLPECFSGHPRDAQHPMPALYPNACWPQAWSSSAVFCLLQALLGLYPYAPLHLLLVDPHLPAWLPEITLRNLRVGDAVATLRFYRKSNGRSRYHVEAKRGPLHVLRQPSPWSLTTGAGERVRDVLESLAPGK